MADKQSESRVDQPVGPPRWVTVTGVVIAAAVVLFVVLHLIVGEGGQHGPSSHGLGDVPLSTAVDQGGPE